MFLPISVLETRMHFRFYVYVEEAGNPSVIQLSAVKATSSEKRGKIQTTKMTKFGHLVNKKGTQSKLTSNNLLQLQWTSIFDHE